MSNNYNLDRLFIFDNHFYYSIHALIDTICREKKRINQGDFPGFFENLAKNRKTYQLGAYQLGHDYCTGIYLYTLFLHTINTAV